MKQASGVLFNVKWLLPKKMGRREMGRRGKCGDGEMAKQKRTARINEPSA